MIAYLFLRRSLLFLSVIGCCSWTSVSAHADEIANKRAELYASYSAKLKELAGWCDQHKLPEQAETTKRWQPERDPNKQYVFFPAASFRIPWKDGTATPDQIEWWQMFSALRKDQATAIFTLAQQALKEHQTRVAFELATETARENPDHEQAQIVLGHVQHAGQWYSTYGAVRVRGGDVWHEKYGWIPQGQVQRYEQGERYVGGRWIKAAEDAQLHSNILSGWRIETEHYVVLTDHSLEEGVALSRRLERLFVIWQQVFFSYHTNEAELTKRFAATSVAFRPPTRHQVMYFRDRDEYNSSLSSTQPNIGLTLGAYFDSTKTAYFFAGEEQDQGTVNHEGTHQLFLETRSYSKEYAKKANFWVIEAVACYLESMVEYADYVTIGGLEEGRVPAARARMFEYQFHVPLAELTGLGMEAMQRDDRVSKMYSESSGLAQFLMHAQQGAYREALQSYLEAVYTGKADATTLEKLIGKSYGTLDTEYREYLKVEK